MDGTLARFHDENLYLERMFEKGFFAGLKPFDNAVEAIKHIIDNHPNVDVYVLSATITTPYCLAEKNAWLDKYLPNVDKEHRILMESSAGFKSLCVPGNYMYKDDNGKIHHQIGVYYVSKSNFGVGQKVGEFTDLSFLAPKNFDAFIETVKKLNLSPEELDKLREQREQEINASLVRLNNDIYQTEKGLGENDRVYLVAASIIATLGVANKVSPLEKSDLKSSTEKGNTDGDIMIRKIEAFLDEKQLPDEKKSLIVRTLQNTLTTDNINKVENGESQLKRVFTKIVDDLGIYYKIGLTTDFTGKLFNEMYSWLGFTQDKLNDVVLTPSYVGSLLVKLARVNKDSYVWDFARGSNERNAQRCQKHHQIARRALPKRTENQS